MLKAQFIGVDKNNFYIINNQYTLVNDLVFGWSVLGTNGFVPIADCDEDILTDIMRFIPGYKYFDLIELKDEIRRVLAN